MQPPNNEYLCFCNPAILTIFILLWMAMSCQTGQNGSDQELEIPSVFSQELRVIALEDNSFQVITPCQDTLCIKSDFISWSSSLAFKDKSLPLPFFFCENFLMGAYWGFLPELGEVIFLESYFCGSSGKSGSISNFTIISFADRSPQKVLSFNSFFGSLEDIKIVNDQTFIQITFHLHEEIYSQSLWVFDAGELRFFEPLGCFSANNKGSTPIGNCPEHEIPFQPYASNPCKGLLDNE